MDYKKKVVKKNLGNYLSLTFILVISFLFTIPLLENINNDMYDEDWFQFSSHNLNSRKSIIEYKQLPLWSPFLGGGFPIIGHPQDMTLSPLFLFILIFGETVGLKLIIILIYLSSALGTYLFSKKVLCFSQLTSSFVALSFVLSSYLPYQLSDGNFHCEPFLLLLPLLLYLYEKSINNKKFIFFSAFLLAIMLFSGAFAFLYIFLAFFMYCLFSQIFCAKKKYFKTFCIIFISLLFIGSIKILPTLEILSNKGACMSDPLDSNPHASTICKENINTVPPNYLSYSNLVNSYLSKSFPYHSTTYTGIIPITFFILGLFFIRKNIIKFLLLFLLFLLLLLGNNFVINIHHLFSYIPLYNLVIKLNKYIPPIILFFFCIISGNFLNKIYLKIKNKKLLISLITLLVLSSIFWQFYSNIGTQSNLFIYPKQKVNLKNNFYQTRIITTSRVNIETSKNQYYNIRKGIGTINWYSSIILDENTIPKYFVYKNSSLMENQKYLGEVYFINRKNKAYMKYFSPNKMIIDVKISKPDTLIINQNYNKYWKTDCGKLFDKGGLLAIEMDTQCKSVKIWFTPVLFFIGLGISLVTLVIYIIFIIKKE